MPQLFGSVLTNTEALRIATYVVPQVARSVGAAAKFCGSGGAIVTFCPGGDEQAVRLKEAMSSAGFCCEPVRVATEIQN